MAGPHFPDDYYIVYRYTDYDLVLQRGDLSDPNIKIAAAWIDDYGDCRTMLGVLFDGSHYLGEIYNSHYLGEIPKRRGDFFSVDLRSRSSLLILKLRKLDDAGTRRLLDGLPTYLVRKLVTAIIGRRIDLPLALTYVTDTLNYDLNVVVDQLLDWNVEQCLNCRIWSHSFGLVGDDGQGIGFCDACSGRLRWPLK